jgi:hypothetical protein
MQNYPYTNQDTVLPPGHYAYTNNFPQTMKTLSPTYTIPTEPVFFDHLMMNLGKTITIVTMKESKGKLTGVVAIDHLQLSIGDLNPQITYFIE